ncbi:MAG: Rab family GTPase [Thermoanaerobaculia bacterium]|nr:Rab family GTPase [Thermoanaerobaculia bacterium]
MIQKKICMVGVFATGKTSLVRRYVHSIFSEKYHSTVGVKVDRQQVEVDDKTVNMVIWDLEGKDGVQDLQTSYLRGSSGILYVADGTRRESFEQLWDLRAKVEEAIGEVPSIVALNKADLKDEWQLGDDDLARLSGESWEHFVTSAKTGSRVSRSFEWLALSMLGRPA